MSGENSGMVFAQSAGICAFGIGIGIGTILVFVHLRICAFVHLCICAFVHLSIDCQSQHQLSAFAGCDVTPPASIFLGVA